MSRAPIKHVSALSGFPICALSLFASGSIDKTSLPSRALHAYPVTVPLVISGKIMDGHSVSELLACLFLAPMKLFPMVTVWEGSTYPHKMSVFPGGWVLEAGGTAVHGSRPFLPIPGH